ncbi:hypothetical protein ACG7TL_001781 [Trametes sanguinea]
MDSTESSIGVLPYRLSEDGYKRFIQAVWDYSNSIYRAQPVPHRYNPRLTVETKRKSSLSLTYLYSTYDFELLSVDGIESLDSIILDEAIEKEIYLHQQIIRDYSRVNIDRAIAWAMTLRRNAAKLEPVPLAEAPSGPTPNLPTLDPEMLENLRAVQDALLPHDKIEIDSEFPADRPVKILKPHHMYPTLPVKYSEVPLCANQYRVVVFDAVGIIMDRVSAIKSALSPFSGAANSYHYDAAKLCSLYLEAEALLLREAPPNESLRSLVDRTLVHLLKQYGVQVAPESTGDALRNASDSVFNPPAFTDAIDSLKLLRDRQFKLVCIHPDDADIRRWVERIVPAGLCQTSSSGYPLRGLHFPTPSLYPQLLARCDDLEPGIQSAQIILVTTGKARQIPYASNANIPTVLVRRETILESRVNLCIPGHTQNPTPSLYWFNAELGALGDKLAPASQTSKTMKVESPPFCAPRKAQQKKAKVAKKSRVKHAPRPDIIFPVEVWSMILKYLLALKGRSEIASMTYLSSGIRLEAEAIIYNSPTLSKPLQMTRLAETLASCSRRALAIRNLTIYAYQHPDSTRYKEVFLSAFQNMKNLSNLYCLPGKRSWYDVGNKIFGFFHKTQPPLRSFRGFVIQLDEVNINILCRLPDLEEMHVASSDVPVDAHKMSELQLQKLRILETDSVSFRSLRASLGSLTHLSITTPLSHATVVDILKSLSNQWISFYGRRELGEYNGRVYPKFPWPRFTMLKYLHIEDYGRQIDRIPNELSGLDFGSAPPALHTLVWSPAWARLSTGAVGNHALGDTAEMRYRDVCCFAARSLQRWSTLQRVLYGWERGAYV